MIFLLKILLIILLLLAVGVLVAGFYRTWQVQHDKREAIFLKGTFPDPLPNGFYNGTIDRKVSWHGKKFNSLKAEGINVFDNGEKYSFITYEGKGLADKNLEVLKIDYNISGNPFWLKFILDEIVQITPNQYLGKLHIRLIPGLPFSLGYFWLKK